MEMTLKSMFKAIFVHQSRIRQKGNEWETSGAYYSPEELASCKDHERSKK